MLKDNVHTITLREHLDYLKSELEFWESKQLEKEMDIPVVNKSGKPLSESQLAERELRTFKSPYSWKEIEEKQKALINKIARLRRKIRKLDKYGDEPQLLFEQPEPEK